MKSPNTLRVNERDIRVAQWVAEQQAVRLDTIAQLLSLWGSPCKDRNLRRLADRWDQLGLMRRQLLIANAPAILWPTASSMKLTNFSDKRVEIRPSITTLHHTVAVARVRVEYEVMGATWTCERSLRGKYPDQHLADGLVRLGQQTALVEVERARKEQNRLQLILATNARTPGIDQVHYWTTPKLKPFLHEQITRLDPSLRNRVFVYLLPQEVI
jgi:hypothetical protein